MGLAGLMAVWAAHAYALIAAGLAGFHGAAMLGARVGHLTQGGRCPGRLDGKGRALAALSAVAVAAMALAVRSAAGLTPGWPAWTGWGAVVLTAATFAANLASPSAAERRLWAPVAGAMLAAGLLAMLS